MCGNLEVETGGYKRWHSATTEIITKTILPNGGGANLLNLCIESTSYPVPDSNDIMLDNFFPFSILNNGVLIVDEQVTPNSGVINTNIGENVDEDQLLFNNENTHHMFYDKEQLTEIPITKYPIKVSTNSCLYKCCLERYLSGFGWVYYNPHHITNTISMGLAKEQGFMIYYNTKTSAGFKVYNPGS